MSGFAYYIYYRVDAGRAAELESRVRAMQDELRRRTGIAGRLLKKRAEPLLWMEIYEVVEEPIAFEPALSDLVNRYRLNEGLQVTIQRQTECFLV